MRCVKLKKICSGYRDTSALQIQDESESVKRKAERQKSKPQGKPPTHSHTQHLAPPKTDFAGGIPTPGSTASESTSSSDSTIDLDVDISNVDSNGLYSDGSPYRVWDISISLKPKAEDVASTYFFTSFTSNSHWDFMRMFAAQRRMDPCLELAIKACGMAALDNVQSVVMGRDYARSMYVQALGLLNDALRDPKRSRMDESLIAVAMLGYYENLTCEGKQSIQSWKAHVKGATQLLKLRGKAQFKSQIGRILFRESRSQIMINCLWDDELPPDFLWEFQPDLEKYTEDLQLSKPMDDVTLLCFDFARLRAKLRLKEISNAEGVQEASEVERKFIQWQLDTTARNQKWQYCEIEVEDSEHVWDGRVHSYSGFPAPSAWNLWRAMRIMLSRTQEGLCKEMNFSEADRKEQMQYFRKTRRQMTDEICATVPVALGHASPAFTSPCVLITAYASIWPLFFAGTCALERVGPGALSILLEETPPADLKLNYAAAQATWIMGRLRHISREVGLKWADGILATLRGDFKVSDEMLTA